MNQNNLRVCGIYMIYCIVSDKKYVGSSNSILRRWNSHKSLLRRNIHKNTHLQSAYNKYGKNSFGIYILEICSENDLVNRETYWIKYHNTKDKNYGYNQEDPSKSFMSEETKQKLRAINLGKTRSEEHCKSISDGKKQSFKENGISKKIIDSIENARKHIKRSISEFSKNRIWTKEQREKVSMRFKGKSKSPRTPEMIENYRNSRRKYCKKVSVNGTIYSDTAEASRNTGIKYTTILSRIKRNINGYQYA